MIGSLRNMFRYSRSTISTESRRVGRRVAQAFDFAGMGSTVGAPPFRVLCERVGGRDLVFLFQDFQSQKAKDRCSHSCKEERKDGAPSAVVFSDKKGLATRLKTKSLTASLSQELRVNMDHRFILIESLPAFCQHSSS